MNNKTKTWLELAENDLEFAGQILKNKQRPYFACHECHQAIEKILKAIVQEKLDEIPPRTHNLPMLVNYASIDLPEKFGKFVHRLNPHYMGTRYPDDLVRFYKEYTRAYSQKLFTATKELFLCLRDYLTQKKW